MRSILTQRSRTIFGSKIIPSASFFLSLSLATNRWWLLTDSHSIHCRSVFHKDLYPFTFSRQMSTFNSKTKNKEKKRVRKMDWMSSSCHTITLFLFIFPSLSLSLFFFLPLSFCIKFSTMRNVPEIIFLFSHV